MGMAPSRPPRLHLPGGATGWRWRALRRRSGCARPASEVPLLVMGALSDIERREALQASADVVVWHEQQVRRSKRPAEGACTSSSTPAWAGSARATRRRPHVRWQAAHEAPDVQAAGAMTHFATADEREDGGFFARQLDRFSAWASEVKARCSPAADRARRKQRRHAARACQPLRHGALRHLHLRHGPVRSRPVAAWACSRR